MIEINIKDDLFYLCSLVEYTARKTKNRRTDIVKALGREGVKKELYDAGVNHCLSFEQVSDEIIETYGIAAGNFDTISGCRYKVPSYMDIGRLYSMIILDCAKDGDIISETLEFFASFITDEIVRFSTDLYYQNPDYLKCCYKAGYILD